MFIFIKKLLFMGLMLINISAFASNGTEKAIKYAKSEQKIEFSDIKLEMVLQQHA